MSHIQPVPAESEVALPPRTGGVANTLRVERHLRDTSQPVYDVHTPVPGTPNAFSAHTRLYTAAEMPDIHAAAREFSTCLQADKAELARLEEEISLLTTRARRLSTQIALRTHVLKTFAKVVDLELPEETKA